MSHVVLRNRPREDCTTCARSARRMGLLRPTYSRNYASFSVLQSTATLNQSCVIFTWTRGKIKTSRCVHVFKGKRGYLEFAWWFWVMTIRLVRRRFLHVSDLTETTTSSSLGMLHFAAFLYAVNLSLWLFFKIRAERPGCSRSHKLLILKITRTRHITPRGSGCAWLARIPRYYRLFALALQDWQIRETRSEMQTVSFATRKRGSFLGFCFQRAANAKCVFFTSRV